MNNASENSKSNLKSKAQAQAKLKAKSESQFLMILGTLVVLVGVPAAWSFLNGADSPVTFATEKVQSRSPASEPTAASFFSEGSKRTQSSTSILNFDCDKSDLSEEVQANYVRLAGVPCLQTEALEIINQSNGFSASVIFTKGRRFTTDFIDLKEGENSLEIVSTEKDGTKNSKILKVVRRIPANTNESAK